MTDNEQFTAALKSLIKRQYLLSIMFLVESYGRDLFVNAILERNPRAKPVSKDKLRVMALGSTFTESIERAEKVLEKVNNLESALGHAIESPDPKEQLFENGYVRKFVKDDIEVEFKRKDCRFVITGVNLKDKDGFYIHLPPLPIQGKMKFVRKLEDGLELWEWDDIGILCGNAGEAIVRDGLVIKSKMTRMA